MFKGLGTVNFTYGSGVASGSNGWSYSIRARFDSQMAAQPQYKGIVDGYIHLANMAIGLADDDYRSKYGVMPGTNLSEFGQWIDGNRQAVYNEAQGWFTYVPSTTPPTTGTTPPTTTQCAAVGKSPIAGQSCCTGLVKDTLGICNLPSNTPPILETCQGTFICSIPDLWIYGGLGILALMMMKR